LLLLWNDPAIGLSSVRKFYLKVRKLHPELKVTEKIIRDFLSKQEAHQINFRQKRPGFHHIIAHYPRNNFQADLLDLQKYKSVNKGHRFILVVVDVYSRYAWMFPLKTKGAHEVADRFVELFKKHIPRDLTTDNGKEFVNTTLAPILKKHGIKHFRFEPGDHNVMGLVERLNGTIRTMLRKYWAALDTKQWVQILPDIEKNYNSTEHSTIKTTPEKAYFMKAAPFRKPAVDMDDFKVGDTVRKKVIHTIFDKKTERWSKNIYTITAIAGRKYVLDDLKTPVKPQDLQLIKGEPEKAPKQIKDAPIAKAAIKKQNIEKLHKALSNDPKNIITKPRVRRKTTSTKFKDFV
jgi:transposase InsO family protein